MVAKTSLMAIVDPVKLDEFCTRHRVRALRVFGSFARGDQRPDSDIDVLLEFQAGCPITMCHASSEALRG